jgi:hypothetical protein
MIEYERRLARVEGELKVLLTLNIINLLILGLEVFRHG